MTNREFSSLMQDPDSSERQSWVKVRWINIGGLSWDVIKTLSIKYDLHPLALEDIFCARTQHRSKADYYPKHLFLQVLCHELKDVDEDDEHSQALTGIPLSSSPEPLSEDDNFGGTTDDDHDMYRNDIDSHNGPTKKKNHRFLPHGGLRDIEAMLNPHDSRLSFTKLLHTEGAVR